jgi:type VI secretion system secreted protein Hcp
MRRKILWVTAALVLIAIPAVIGVVALSGDDGSARRAAALVPEGSPAAAYQLVVDGITPAGEAVDVVSYSWGVTGAPISPTTGTASGKAQFSNLEISKKLDETSPLFVKAATLGSPHSSAVLNLFRGGSGKPYATYTLTNAHVASVAHGGSADAVPTENISLSYSKLTIEIASVDADGQLGATRTFTYDVGSSKG